MIRVTRAGVSPTARRQTETGDARVRRARGGPPETRERDPHEAAQHASRVGEIQSGVEVPDEGEDVAFAVAQRVPPTAAVMVDDDNLAFAAAVFEAAAGTLSTVELPNRRQPL